MIAFGFIMIFQWFIQYSVKDAMLKEFAERKKHFHMIVATTMTLNDYNACQK